MAKTIELEMITPERVALRGSADFVVLPARRGELGVLPGHEPFWVELQAGELRVSEGGEAKRYAVAGGFAEILPGRVRVFAETAEMAEEIDAEAARQELEKAKAESTQRDIDPLTLAAAEAAIRLAQVKLRVAELRGRRGRQGPPPQLP